MAQLRKAAAAAAMAALAALALVTAVAGQEAGTGGWEPLDPPPCICPPPPDES